MGGGGRRTLFTVAISPRNINYGPRQAYRGHDRHVTGIEVNVRSIASYSIASHLVPFLEPTVSTMTLPG